MTSPSVPVPVEALRGRIERAVRDEPKRDPATVADAVLDVLRLEHVGWLGPLAENRHSIRLVSTPNRAALGEEAEPIYRLASPVGQEEGA